MSEVQAADDLGHRFTKELLAYIDAERATLEPEAQPLLDQLESVVASGGKRLRPRFAYWGFRAGGGTDPDSIFQVGAALELVHTMALIHDDVMDGSVLRRSRPSTFNALAQLAAGAGHKGDPKRFGASAAILVGLLGFVLADGLFAAAEFPSERKRAALLRFDLMRSRAIAGQYLDLLAAHRGDADEAAAMRIAALKSGMYTVADPLAIGALLASDDAGVVSALEQYGLPLGEAFQLRDDILGTFGDPNRTGKDRDGDIREGKQTVLLAKAKAGADAAQRRVLDAHVGDATVSAAEADDVRRVLVDTGALEGTELLVADLLSQAKGALDRVTFDPHVASALGALADEAAMRHA
jgi:geranylgeranyl diphosphate synthase, type I